MNKASNDALWDRIREETLQHAGDEPMLASFLYATILNHPLLERPLRFHLASQLDSPTASSLLLRDVIQQASDSDSSMRKPVRAADFQPFAHKLEGFFHARSDNPRQDRPWHMVCLVVIVFADQRDIDNFVVVGLRRHRTAIQDLHPFGMNDRRRKPAGNVIGDVTATDGDRIREDDLAVIKHGDGCCAAAHIDEGDTEILFVFHQAG